MDPKNADQRRRTASRGGKGKPSREIRAIKSRLSTLADDVLAGKVDRSDAAVVSQVLNVHLPAVSVEMKVREQLELEARLEELEASWSARTGGRVMGLRGKLKRLERLAEGKVVVIPQVDGSVKRFPETELREAYSNLMERLGAGEHSPAKHPLIEAARNSSDPKWTGSFFAVDNPDDWIEPIEDLSE